MRVLSQATFSTRSIKEKKAASNQSFSIASRLYLQGIEFSLKKDYAAAYRCFLEATQHKHAKATYEIGKMYVFGLYPELNYRKGFHYMELAYDLGRKYDLEPIIDIGDEISKSEVGIKSYRHYLEHVFQAGGWEMAILIGSEYRSGVMYPKNIAKAIEYYQEAISHGYDYGYLCLGEIYFKGEDVETDYQKAFQFFQDYKGENDVKSYYLGEMYHFGYYVEKNEEKAELYYRKIVEGNIPWKADEFFEMAISRLKEILGDEMTESIIWHNNELNENTEFED